MSALILGLAIFAGMFLLAAALAVTGAVQAARARLARIRRQQEGGSDEQRS